MAVFFLFFTVEFGVRSLLDECEQGTLARLLVAPIRPATVLIGKAVASFPRGTVHRSARHRHHVAARFDLGAPVGVALLVLAGVVTAVGVTAFVATLAKTSAQAGS